MKYDKFEISITLAVSPELLFNAWLDSKEHSGFINSQSECSELEGGKFLIDEAYINGRNLEIIPYTRILQSWRTSDFKPDDENSFIEILFAENAKGCRLKIKHSNLPQGDGEKYQEGWKEYYFKPMKEYFKQDDDTIIPKISDNVE